MLKIPDHLLLYEPTIQDLLLKADKKISENVLSDYKFLREYQEGLIEYTKRVYEAIADGIALNVGVNPNRLKKSMRIGMNDLIRISIGDVNENDILLKGLFDRLKKKFSFFANWLKKFKWKPLEPIKFKGKILYDPETKKPLTGKNWKMIEDGIVDFLKDKIGSYKEEVLVRAGLMGKLIQAMERKGLSYNQIKNKSYDDIQKEYGELPQTVEQAEDDFDLSKQEKYTIQYVEDRAAEHLAVPEGHIGKQVIDSARYIISESLREGASKQDMISRLYHVDVSEELEKKYKNYSMPEWNRNWWRVVQTETSMAKNNGYIQAWREEIPKDKDLYFVFVKTAILKNSAKKDISFNGTLVKFVDEPLTDDKVKKDKYGAKYYIWPGKNNIGRNQNDWWICIPMHPNCIDRWERISPEEQYYDKEINKVLYKLED